MKQKQSTSVQILPSLLSLVMLMVMVSAIVVLAQAPDYAFDPAQMKLASRHAHPGAQVKDELTQRFEQAVLMLHAKRYDNAVVALHRVIELSPRMTEAYVNMGYALLGLKDNKAAHDFFSTAIDLNPYQANAYWGLAVTLEDSGDLKAALGAMRIFIHLSKPDNPFVRRARSAIWEWESTLARGPLPEGEKAFLKRGMERWEEHLKPRSDIPVR